MQSNDVNAAAVNGKEAAYFGVPWEDAYGYAQAIKVGDTIHFSGQISHDEKGNLIAPASLDESGKPAEFSMMEHQMRATYANAVKLWRASGQRRTTSSRRPQHSRCGDLERLESWKSVRVAATAPMLVEKREACAVRRVRSE
jgi:hypothetical protein